VTFTNTRSDAYVVMRRMFDEGFSTGDGTVVDELCSPDLVEHQVGFEGPPAEALQRVKDAMRDVHSAVPDISAAAHKNAVPAVLPPDGCDLVTRAWRWSLPAQLRE
jgi:hypothetical protein